MKILMLNHNLVGRGSYLRCWHLARQLSRWGHRIDLVTAADSVSLGWQDREVEGVQVQIPPRFGKLGRHDGGYAPIDILARIPLALRRWDLIHAFEHRPNVTIPALLSRIRRTPLAIDWSDWWTKGGITTSRRSRAWVDRWEGNLIEEGTKKLAGMVTVVSSTLSERALSIGIREDRLALVPSGSDCEGIVPKDKEACRRELGLPLRSPVLCFSGFAFWDFKFLTQAFLRILAEFPESRLLVVGQDKDGDVEGIAREVLGQRADHVVFAGRFNPANLSLPLGSADIQLLPLPDTLANRARWPIKFGDYLASGRPTVVSDVGDVPVVVREEGVGEVAGTSAEDFAEGIRRLLRDPDRIDDAGKRARTLAEGRLSWEEQARKMLAVYNKCTSAG